jgi:hypothetical protein
MTTWRTAIVPRLCTDAIAQTALARLLRQYPRQRNRIILAPQSGQTKLRIAEIKLMLVLPTTANAAILSLTVVAVPRRMHRTLSAESRRSVFWEGTHWRRTAALRVR